MIGRGGEKKNKIGEEKEKRMLGKERSGGFSPEKSNKGSTLGTKN